MNLAQREKDLNGAGFRSDVISHAPERIGPVLKAAEKVEVAQNVLLGPIGRSW